MQGEKKKPSTAGTGCAVVAIVAVVLIGGFYIFRDRQPVTAPPAPKASEEKPDSTVKLKANVSFSGTQFVITNNDSFDWRNVKLEINSGVIRGGYILKEAVLQAGKEYTVGAMQFAKGDGTRFNPFQMKPKNFSISCDTAKGKLTGFWYGGWE